jgi:hypothetical protein
MVLVRLRSRFCSSRTRRKFSVSAARLSTVSAVRTVARAVSSGSSGRAKMPSVVVPSWMSCRSSPSTVAS